MTRYTRIEWIRGGSDPPDQPAGGTLSLQEITGLQYRESVERRPQEIGEITPIECQQNIGPRSGRKQDRPVACRRKHVGHSKVSTSGTASSFARSGTQL